MAITMSVNCAFSLSVVVQDIIDLSWHLDLQRHLMYLCKYITGKWKLNVLAAAADGADYEWAARWNL